MRLPFFNKFSSGGTLGIDIGTASIKAVELVREGGRFKLLNYGIFELESQDKSLQANQKINKLPDQDIIWGIQEVIKQAGIKSKNVVASIPSFSTFATVITLPYLSEKELAKTIPFEAKKYIPIPLEEVVLDWSITSIVNSAEANTGRMPPNVEVFLAAVPRAEVERYRKIMLGAGLNLTALELENSALIRSLIGNDLSPIAVVNIGGRSTSILVVEAGYERVGHNYEVAHSAGSCCCWWWWWRW
jgi:type IV pilus assembly protein PilM